MVVVNRDEGNDWRFVIRPNRSLTWPQAQLFFLSLAAVCLGVAVVFAAFGFWPILPFAGAEVAALGACIYMSALGGREVEVVRISREIVAVEKGRERARRTWRFARAWARIDLRPSALAWHPSRLLIGSHGKLVQLGGFLTEEERRQLAGDLARAIARGTFGAGTTEHGTENQ